jgi:hypothetical protein
LNELTHAEFMGFSKLSSANGRSVAQYPTILIVMYTRIVYELPTDNLERYHVEDMH